MENDLAVIEKVIAEHKTIRQRVHKLEQVANDTEAMAGFEEAKEAFMPGRLDQKQGLSELKDTLGAIEEGLQKHFHFEEISLPTVVDRHGDEELKSSLQSILLEHADLRNRLNHSKNHAAELASGNMARHRWEAAAHDMRAYISHTRKLLETHAGIEQTLLQELRKRLKK
jgi:iron-sulfur cluster repair protein YtfE (RIC family)